MSSYLTTSIIRYRAKNVMPRERTEYIYRRKDEEEKEKRERDRGREKEREGTTVPHECTQSRRRRSVPTSIPRCCDRSYVRASRCYDPISIPPWSLGRSSLPLRAPLQIDWTIPHARRSSCTASSSASLRPHRDHKRGDRARKTSLMCLRSTRSLLVSPCGCRAPPPPTRVRFLLLLSSTASFISSFSSTVQPRDTLA